MLKKNSTKEIIVQKAVEMFNEQGVEYVGVRELAKELGMKGGNITYYFPTKDDIVMEVSMRLGEENNKILQKRADLRISEFLGIFGEVFKNHYNFRGLFLSFPHLLRQNEAVRLQYAKRKVLRRNTILEQLADMEAGGYLRIPEDRERNNILNTITLISRFWISNASVEEDVGDMALTMDKYIELIAGQLRPFATAKGRKDLDRYYEAK